MIKTEAGYGGSSAVLIRVVVAGMRLRRWNTVDDHFNPAADARAYCRQRGRCRESAISV